MFTKSKKFLLSFSTLAVSTLAITIAVSCSSNEEEDELKIIKVSDGVIQRGSTAIKDAIKNKVEFRDARIAIFTAGGDVNDLSFNQSSFEVSKLIKREITKADKARGNKVEVVPYNTPQGSDAATLAANYSAALEDTDARKHQNIWIASGFQHNEGLQTWLGKDENRTKFVEKNILIIGVDWTASDSESFKWPKGQIITLNFKTEENSYILGYAAAKYLSDTYPNDESKRKLVTFGGADFPGVTRFIHGFLKGAIQFNEDAKKANKPLVKWPSEQPNIELTTGFNPSTADAKTKGTNVVTKGKPQIIFPVAGPLVGNVLEDLDTNNSSALILGVDVDQTLSYPRSKGRFFSSAAKNIASAIFQTLIPFITKDNTNKALKGIPDSLGPEKQFIFKGDQSEGLFNIDVDQGISRNFVNVTEPTLSDAKDLERAKAALKAGSDAFAKPANSADLASRPIKPNDKNYLNELVKQLINPNESSSS